MAKKPAPESTDVVDLEYCGPSGQLSALFGPLVVGQRYQASVTFAAYLLEHHPDYWKRPDA